MLNEPATEHRAYRCGDRCESRPGANRATAPVLGEIGADQGQAAGDQQRPPYSLEGPGNNQMSNVGCESAPDGRQREEAYTGGKHLAPAIKVAQSPAREKQCCEKKSVSLHDPLNLG